MRCESEEMKTAGANMLGACLCLLLYIGRADAVNMYIKKVAVTTHTAKMASRRMSVCLEDTKHDKQGKVCLCVAECSSMGIILGTWGYFMYEVLRPNVTDHINLFGVTFYKGSAFDDLLFNSVVYFNFFGVMHVVFVFMLISKKSSRARAICGYNNVDPRQSPQMTILTALYFNAVLSTTSTRRC